MASANLELVRSIVAEWERGDFRSVDWADPQIEFVIADGPTPGRWTGIAGLAEGWREYLSVWDDFHAQVDEYRELDAERVLVLNRFAGRGRASGMEVGRMQKHSATLLHVRGGQVTRIVLYFDADRALADLGLAPEGADESRPRDRS